MRAIAPALLAALLLSVPALADDLNLPARKAGQWEIKMELRAGMPAMTSEMCIDEATDRAMMKTGLAAGECTQMNMQRTSDGYTIDSVCQHGAMTTKSHVVVSGDFQSAYTVKVDSDITGGPPQMPAHSAITQQATWKGACNGLAPGEMLINGMKVNALKALGGGG